MATFAYFGEEFTYAPEFPHFAQAEFFEAMEQDDLTLSSATAVALRLAVACVSEDERARFRKVSREHNAKTEDWVRVFRDYTAEEADRPTERSADSSAGPSDTAPQSVTKPDATVTSLPASTDEVPGRVVLAARRSGLISA